MRYVPGDFFVPHRDVEEVEGEAVIDVQRRFVSLLIFLNAPDDPDVPYQGGDLTLYGLLDIPDSEKFGFPLNIEQGMLVAYRSNTLHGVSPILSGNRYVIIGVFYDQS